jgi:hypothetical protein
MAKSDNLPKMLQGKIDLLAIKYPDGLNIG